MRKPGPHQFDMLFADTLFRIIAEGAHNRLDPGHQCFAPGLQIDALDATVHLVALADNPVGGLESVKDTHKCHWLARQNMSQLGLAETLVLAQNYQHARFGRRQSQSCKLEFDQELFSKCFDEGNSLKGQIELFREEADASIPLWRHRGAARRRVEDSHSGTP